MTIEFDSFTPEPPPVRRPRRAVAVLGAAMLVAAAGGIGFGLGTATGSGDSRVAPGDAAPITEPLATASTDTPDDPSPVDSTEEGADVVADTVAAAEVDETSAPAAGDGDVAASGGGGWTIFGNEPAELLVERVTESGITLRAHLGQLWDNEDIYYDDVGGGDGWQPPGWCFESGQVRIALGGAASGTSVIDVGSVNWWSEPFNGRAISSLVMGTADGNPHRVVFVQAPSDVTNVGVTFADGATDAVAPTDGVAVLVAPGAPESVVHDDGTGYTWTEWTMGFDVTFERGDADATTIDGTANGWKDPEYVASCSPPPPALPDPGVQPVDADAHEQTIVELMAAIYSESDSEVNAERIDDPTGVAEARDQVREGGFEEAAANAEAIVEELVFTSPTEAWFRYRIETTSGTFGQRFGIARSIDGTWKITRDTICQDLSLAGGDCGGDVREVFPPAG